MSHPKNTIHLTCSQEMREEVEKAARGDERSVSSWVRRVIKKELERVGS